MSVRILFASLLALSLTAQQAPVQGPQGRQGRGPIAGGMARAGERAAFMAHHLKLSADQKAQIKDIHQKQQATQKANQKAAMEAREAFRTAAQDPLSTPDQLRKLHQVAADRQFEQVMAQRTVRLQTRAVLTPEQRAEADRMQTLGESHRQFRQQRLGKMMERRQGRAGGPGMGPGGLEMDSD
jgi:Spy/CpxP family protein refolding chaperone